MLEELSGDSRPDISALRKALHLRKKDAEKIVAKLPQQSEIINGPEPIMRGLQDLLSDAGFKTVVEKL
jgi:hypothetical protein